jgi:hypothetical protein
MNNLPDYHLDALFRSSLANEAEALALTAASEWEMQERVSRALARQRTRRQLGVLILAAALLSLTFGVMALAGSGLSRPVVPDSSAFDTSEVVVTQASAPAAFTVHLTFSGNEALEAARILRARAPGFVDATLTGLDDSGELHVSSHAMESEDAAAFFAEVGQYGTFVAVFRTVGDAEKAFGAARAHLESPDGWRMTPATIGAFPNDPHQRRGNEAVYYTQGSDYGYPIIGMYLWRVENTLLQAVDLHVYDHPSLLRELAEDMDLRVQAELRSHR